MAKAQTQAAVRRVQPQAEIETEEETETKEEAAVAVSPALATLMTNWRTAFGKAEAFFPRICWHVIEQDTSRKELKQALKQFRGFEEGAHLNNTLSKIMRLKERPEVVQACLNHEINPATGKEWTVRELEKVGVKKQEGREERTNDQKLHILLTKAGEFSIKELKMKLRAFLTAAQSAYEEAAAKEEGEKVRTRAAKAEAAIEEEPEEEITEEEFEEAELE